MSQDNYVRLIERINQNPIKHAQTDALMDFVKEVFSDEQAAFIGDFPIGAYTPKELSEKLGKDEAALDKMLTEMSANDLLFEGKRENGDKEYSVLPFEPGLMEFQFIRGRDDERTRKFVKLQKAVHSAEAAILEYVLKEQPEMAKQAFSSSSPAGRIVAIEESISNDKEIISWERLSNVIENETSYAAGECTCKHMAKLSGNPCKSGAPSQCCVWFGTTADYMVERELARRLTKDEVYELMKKCEDAGLVHFMGNKALKNNILICNCCKCCCAYLALNMTIREFDDLKCMETSNFAAVVNKDTCNGCGECVDYCQLEALQLSDDVVSVNPHYCLGCGSCISKCPTDSLSLVRISKKKPLGDPIPVLRPGV